MRVYRSALKLSLFIAVKCKCKASFLSFLVKIFSFFNIYNSYLVVKLEKLSAGAECLYSSRVDLYAAMPRYDFDDNPLEVMQQNDIACHVIDDVRCIGLSNLLLFDNETAYYPLFFYDKQNKFVLRDVSVVEIISEYALCKHKNEFIEIEEAIFLLNNFSENYYHFMYEVLVKFYLIKLADIPDSVPLLVDSVVNNSHQLSELLCLLNNQKRKVIFLDKGTCCNVRKLYYPSMVNYIAPDYRNIEHINYYDCLFDVKSLSFLREQLIVKSANVNYGEKIFLSRKSGSSRRRYNEKNIVEIVSRYGFSVIDTGVMSISEQISAFNKARYIIGVTGASFTNIIYCCNGARVLCMQSSQNELSIFSTIAKFVGADFYYFSAAPDVPSGRGLHVPFWVDPTVFESFLQSFLQEPL